MSKKPTLIGLGYSPWTQRARWSLEHCGVDYRWQKYQPFLGEPALRAKLGKWTGPVTVPVLLSEQQNISGGFEIARFAAKKSGLQSFWDEAPCARWEKLADEAVAEARDRMLPLLQTSEAAVAENVRGVPFGDTAPVRALARWVMRQTQRKYAHTVQPGTMRVALQTLQTALAESANDYITGRFSYADVAAVTLLDGIKPVSNAYVGLGPASRACWTDETLVSEYADLLAWRDCICDKHRRKRPDPE